MMNSEYYSIDFHYTFQSGLGAYDASRFVRSVDMQITCRDDDGGAIEKVGSVSFLVLFLSNALDAGFPLYDLLDGHSEYLTRHIFNVFDPDQEEFTEKMIKRFGYDFNGNNICFIENITILPKFRGYNIGAKAIKDIIFHYSASVALFMLQPFPLQFEVSRNPEKNSALDLVSFEKDKRKASKKLGDYYKSMGFHSVAGIKDLLFYNPLFRNKQLENFDLEDSNVFSDRRKSDQ